MTSRIDQAFQFHQTALSLRAARQELLASNITNADTPNYKAKDIDFASALQGAMAGRSGTGSVSMAVTSPRHIEAPATGSGLFGAQVMYRSVIQPSADGNTVDMDVERGQFADNALRYEASVKFVSDEGKDVLAALQG
ncbi:MAG: flagellar basal body rod protein FlgB [Nitrosomonadales bacterium]|nr:flagellar basal body rod protein FlgB [Nitrosomonadales bacterium]